MLESYPIELKNRYSNIPSKILIRKCYEDLYEEATAEMLNKELRRPAFLFTGISGIGKSIFMIYFLCRYSVDDRFGDKRFALEFDGGDSYHVYTPANVAGKYHVSRALPNEYPIQDLLVFSDILVASEAQVRSKWLLIFSYLDPLRYKETMKIRPHYTYIMPTWSAEELLLVYPNRGEWYSFFEKRGGVVREILWCNTSQVEERLECDIERRGPRVAENFLSRGFGVVDTEFTLVHVNPPRSQDGSYSYAYGGRVYTFASDYVFRKLEPYLRGSLLRQAAPIFNAGGDLASDTYGAQTAAKLFEQMCFWHVPLAGSTIACESLGDNQLPLQPSWLHHRNVLVIIGRRNTTFSRTYCISHLRLPLYLVMHFVSRM